jgi:hypothetical protein
MKIISRLIVRSVDLDQYCLHSTLKNCSVVDVLDGRRNRRAVRVVGILRRSFVVRLYKIAHFESTEDDKIMFAGSATEASFLDQPRVGMMKATLSARHKSSFRADSE